MGSSSTDGCKVLHPDFKISHKSKHMDSKQPHLTAEAHLVSFLCCKILCVEKAQSQKLFPTPPLLHFSRDMITWQSHWEDFFVMVSVCFWTFIECDERRSFDHRVRLDTCTLVQGLFSLSVDQTERTSSCQLWTVIKKKKSMWPISQLSISPLFSQSEFITSFRVKTPKMSTIKTKVFVLSKYFQ